MNKAKYPNLAAEIARRGIVKRRIAETACMSYRNFYEKMNGLSPFNWNEVCAIQETFFPDVSKEYLFATE